MSGSEGDITSLKRARIVEGQISFYTKVSHVRLKVLQQVPSYYLVLEGVCSQEKNFVVRFIARNILAYISLDVGIFHFVSTPTYTPEDFV